MREAVDRLRAAVKGIRKAEEKIATLERTAQDLAWIMQAVATGELRPGPGRSLAPGHALPEGAWPETRARLDGLDLPEPAWTAVDNAARAMHQVEAIREIDALLHADTVRLGPGRAWRKGAKATDERWSAWKSVLESLDLPAPAWRRLEATAADAGRRRRAQAEEFVLPLVASGVVAPDPARPGRWQPGPGTDDVEGLQDVLQDFFGSLPRDHLDWAVELARLVADPVPERAASFRARSLARAMKLAERLDDAGTGASAGAAEAFLADPASPDDGSGAG